jgi:hypothetical protein
MPAMTYGTTADGRGRVRRLIGFGILSRHLSISSAAS